MAKQSFQNKYFAEGQTDYSKDLVIQNGFYLSQAIDYRTDPQAITLLPAALKESGSNVTDLLKWADTVPSDLSVYSYGSLGNIYKRTSAGSWSNLRTVPTSHGNGLAYYAGDDYIYYTSDKVIGRYGQIAGTPSFTDDFLGAQGGVPQNTASLLLASASSQYASAADSTSLSITGDLTLETFFKANTLPTVGNSMILVGKWDESGTTRSYKLDLYGVSGYFGDGSDGSLTIAADTTEAPIDSTCTGTSGTQTLTATNASFAVNQVILIHQSQGTNAGKWERNTIQGYTAGTITLGTPLVNSYTTGAQVRVLKQYTNVTVNSTKIWTSKSWNGTVGGILTFLASGTTTITGSINANGNNSGGGGAPATAGIGFIGGAYNDGSGGKQGDGTPGAGISSFEFNGNGGGGGGVITSGNSGNGGGGGGNGDYGIGGSPGSNGYSGQRGYPSGSTDLTTATFGGGGGAGGPTLEAGTPRGGGGGSGGGLIFITSTILTVTGAITSNGGNGGGGNTTSCGSGGGGAGGSILLKAQTATLGTNLITAIGGNAGVTGGSGAAGGAGGEGRIHLDYYTSYTGTTNPTLNATQDNTLVTTTTIQARLGISNDGTSFEYLTKNLSNLTTGVWNRLSVPWVSSTSTATFYLNAVSLGTSTGTKTAIHDNASLLYVGANKTTVIANFFDGLLNDMRIWANAQSSSQIYSNNLTQLLGTEGGLKAYYKFNSAYTDSTANVNTLTPHNSPTFSADVPFAAPTTRLDIDQSYTVTGDTYALPTAISEAVTDQLPFSPLLDPQKSIDFNIAAKGTGNWTATIHDQQNRSVATATVTNANLSSSGFFEFVFATPWRIVINKSYHAHLTSTVNDGTIVSSTNNDLRTGDFHTYFGFLVTDTQFHPIAPFLNKLIIGNERYLATWDGASYNANFIAFPPQTHIRCFGFWREYIAIGTWREASSGTPNIYDWPTGKIYFWDGISLTFNFWIDVAEGQINALQGNNNILFVFAGYKGDILVYQGGFSSLSTSAQKIKRLPLQTASDFLEIYPGAVNMWRSLLHFGATVNSNSTTILKGVYSWGTLNINYKDSLSLDYPISTGNITGSAVKIGLVYPIGQTLLIGWQDGSAFGCDQVTFSNSFASYGQIQTLIQDNNIIWKEKVPLVVRADHKALRSGESIDVAHKVDREANWQTSPLNSIVGEIFTQDQITDGRGREVQYQIEMYSTGSTSPTLLGLSAYFDDLTEEQQFG